MTSSDSENPVAPVVDGTSGAQPPASVSVIVPSYNDGRFIAEAIDSILAQTLQPDQVIIVDDGSTDDTAQVVGRYADHPRLQYIRLPHSGAAAARNAGLDAARCEFVAFLDADDRWRPTFLETMHAFLTADPTVACVFCNFVRFQHGTGELLGDQFQHYPELRRPVLLRDAPNAYARIPKERAFSVLVACAEIPACMQAMMFRRELIGATRFDPTLVLGADTNFALRTFMLGGVVFTDEVLAEVRRHDGSAMHGDEEISVKKLDTLKALAPHVTRTTDQTAYRDRLIRAHIDAALSQMKLGRTRASLGTYRFMFDIPGSGMRKFKGTLRLAMALLTSPWRARIAAAPR